MQLLQVLHHCSKKIYRNVKTVSRTIISSNNNATTTTTTAVCKNGYFVLLLVILLAVVIFNITTILLQSQQQHQLLTKSSSSSSSTTTTSTKILPIQQQNMKERILQQQQQVNNGVGQVTSFRFINATNGNRGDVLINPLMNNTIIRLSNYPIDYQFSIDAITTNSTSTTHPIGSIRFQFTNGTVIRTETSAPYSLCGDNGIRYIPCTFLRNHGVITIIATPYSQPLAMGIVGTQRRITLNIVDVVPVPNPVPVKVPVPIPVPIKAPVPVPVPVKAPLPVPVPLKAPVPVPVPIKVPLPVPVPIKVPVPVPLKVPVKVPVPVPPPVRVPTLSPTMDLPAGWIVVNPNAPLDARHEACFVMVGRKAYLLAGRGVKPVNIYDPISRTWSNGPAPPIQIHHSQCITVDDSIWIVSPWTGGFPRERNVGDIHIYNTTTNTWSKKPGLPESRQRGGVAVVLVGRKIYVSHGNIGGHETDEHAISLNWLDYYDIDKNLWVTNLPNAPHVRDHAGGAYVNGRICIAGGRDGGQVDFFSKVILPTDCYNPITNTWSVEANIPQGRAGSSYGTTCDGKLMVAGGEGPDSAYSNVDVFNGTTWTTIDPLNGPRHGSGLAVDCICNQIHIASGAITRGGRYEVTSVETLFPNGIDVPCRA